MNCIAIDDKRIDLLTTVSYIKKFPQLQLAGYYDSPEKALKDADFEQVDVLFLDIDMPGINGFEFRKKMDKIPICIFITAFPEHALESFSVETLDFIVKPLRQERFAQAVARLEQFMAVHKKASLYESYVGGNYVSIKDGHKEIKVNLHEILYLETFGIYTLVVTQQKSHCVRSSLSNLLKEQCFDRFVRIHKSFAVRKDVVKTTATNQVTLINDTFLPIGRVYKENIRMLI